MNAAAFIRDITAFSVQIALVAMVIALLVKIVRIPARARYLSLRLALAAALVAPWLLRVPEMQAHAPSTVVARTVSLITPPATSAQALRSKTVATTPVDSIPAIPWTQVGLGALLIGVVARTLWLAVGMVRLLRLARQGAIVDAPEYSALQQQLGTCATIMHVAGLSQPATFGIRRPIVLLPDALAEAAASLRRAVVTHELFHVRRHDWLCVLGEELVRTALWFHPAILWLTSHIQLAREEIVDELTVQATGDRRTYVEALLAFADAPGLSPAPAFGHRRQLFHRILSVSKEKVMSRPRIASSAAVVLAAVAGAGWYASTVFPIVKAAKAENQQAPSVARVTSQAEPRIDMDGDVVLRDGSLVVRGPGAVITLNQRSDAVKAVEPVRPVTPENPIPRRIRGVAPVRPSRFADVHVVISPLVTLDRNGTVTSVARDACEVSGERTSTREDVCDAFFEPTAAAIRQWRYERPAQGPLQFYVHVRYQPGAEPTITQSAESYRASARVEPASRRALQEERLREEARELEDRAAALIARSREIERAQRLSERGLLANPNPATLRAETARLNAELASVEEQLRSVSAPGTSSDQARVAAQLQVIEAQRHLEEQYRASLEQRARAELQARAAAETLREAERRLAEYQREREQAATVDVNRQPAPARGNLRPLVSPSGRAPVETRGPNGAKIPGLQMPVSIKSVKPTYPPEAKEARMQGTVVVEALIDEKGHVADARVLKGLPQFDGAALDAAKQWEFKPATLNGETVPVIVVLEMEFNLR